ncbi:MAG: PQQ-binding-like beta-propeller repeat protein [Actinomycetota bacterium]|nr:PQQ-binding-like beta-propeller repeat protein [Actinomycetota bacterium]
MRTFLTPLRPLRRALRTAAVASSMLVVIGSGAAMAQRSSGWTQFQGGPGKTGATATGPEPGYGQAWRTPFAPGGPGDRYGLSAPVIAGGVAVAVGPEQVIGVDVASGEELFEVARDLGPSVPAAVASSGPRTAILYTEGWGAGPPSPTPTADASPSGSPSVPAGGGTDAFDSHLAAFDLETQEALWPPVQLDGVSRTGVTVDASTAFVGVNGGTVTAVDVAEGSVIWQQELGGTLLTPIAAADGLVLVGLQGDRDTQPVIVALDAATGQERWRHEPTDPAAVVSAVSVSDGRVFAIFTGLSETSVFTVDLTDGSQEWSRRLNATFDVVAPPVVGEGTVLVTDLIGHTRAFDPETGEQRWDFAQNAPAFRSVPLLVGAKLLVPTLEGELAAIDTRTGELVWRGLTDGVPVRSLAVAGEVLVAVRGSTGSGLEGIEHDPDVALVRQSSPTTLDPGRMLAAIAIATVPVLAVVLLFGRWLAPRMGPAFTDDEGHEDDAADDQATDPWEDEDPAL